MHDNLRNQTVEKGKNEERRSQTLPNKSVRYKRCSTNLNKQHRKKRVGLSIYNVVKNPSSLTHTLSTHNLRALRLSQNPISLSLSLYELRSLSLSLSMASVTGTSISMASFKASLVMIFRSSFLLFVFLL